MRVALVGAELEENMGLRYMASSLHQRGHQAAIIPFNNEADIPEAVERITAEKYGIVGMSMVFTSRAREFTGLASSLRDRGYGGHIIAGGHFASLNCRQLLHDSPQFDSVGLGEGERLICDLADNLRYPSRVPNLCYRTKTNRIKINPLEKSHDELDSLPFPLRTDFHRYFDQPIASVLSSRGCWRSCAFCSINAWYKQCGGKRFRVRSVDNIVAEMRELHDAYGVTIFNFQDDNFFLPKKDQALKRFKSLRDGLRKAGIDRMAIAIKARPDSITRESIEVLDDLGLFRVFLGVENASQRGLDNLNRKNTVEEVKNSLAILNDFDIHIAYNLLMFEPDTVLDDIRLNLRFMEKNIENPFNFCRAEAYAGTGLETKLLAENRLEGDYFGLDYRLKDPYCEAFHQISNYAFFDRNFNNNGLHYFNMQVDFYFQLLRRFHPEVLTMSLRSDVRNFIKETNLDTYACLCRIYDFVERVDPTDMMGIRRFASELRRRIDWRSLELRREGERILAQIDYIYINRNSHTTIPAADYYGGAPEQPRKSSPSDRDADLLRSIRRACADGASEYDFGFGTLERPIPYEEFHRQLKNK